MRKLFYYLLNKYSKIEEDRLIILDKLDDKVCEEYSEQTTFGNVYNYFIEFVMSNNFIKGRVKKNDKESLKILKRGIDKAFDEGVGFIEEGNIIIKPSKGLQIVVLAVSIAGYYCAWHEASIRILYDYTNDVLLGGDSKEEVDELVAKGHEGDNYDCQIMGGILYMENIILTLDMENLIALENKINSFTAKMKKPDSPAIPSTAFPIRRVRPT